uniref:Uncharacterized protein n=1 Tax=Anguilla anguilla TaxID=7936 RepID=A0A0E9PD35_ANGAN
MYKLVSVYIYIYAHICVYRHAYVHVCIYVHIHVRTHDSLPAKRGGLIPIVSMLARLVYRTKSSLCCPGNLGSSGEGNYVRSRSMLLVLHSLW